MFTIKCRRDNAALITEAQEVCLAKPGSPQYEDAVELAHEFGLLHPDLIQTFKREDAPQNGVLNFLKPKLPGSYVLTTERKESQPGKPIAVLVSDTEDPNMPGVPGTGYQFVYYGDELYIMNRFGQTVELINRKSHHKAS
jgi:hypothetical protein